MFNLGNTNELRIIMLSAPIITDIETNGAPLANATNVTLHGYNFEIANSYSADLRVILLQKKKFVHGCR